MRLLALAALLGACATPPTAMRVMIDPSVYAASMSSKIGLALTPIAEPPPGTMVRYRWRADGGRFLSRPAGTNEIVVLGREALTEGGPLFWSYDPGEQAAREKRPVALTIVTENAKNGREMARTDVTLVWDGDQVRPAH